jgi:hypothetical protein
MVCRSAILCSVPLFLTRDSPALIVYKTVRVRQYAEIPRSLLLPREAEKRPHRAPGIPCASGKARFRPDCTRGMPGLVEVRPCPRDAQRAMTCSKQR